MSDKVSEVDSKAGTVDMKVEELQASIDWGHAQDMATNDEAHKYKTMQARQADLPSPPVVVQR